MTVGVYGGACIEQHSVYITDRGGSHRFAQLIDIESVQWTRLRDQVSEASVTIRGAACAEQATILAAIEPKRSEMVIYRGSQRVWEGPVNRVGWHADWVEISARDVMDYLYGRPLSIAWDNSYPDTTTVLDRMQAIVNYELTQPFLYRDANGNPVMVPAWETLDPPIDVLPYFTIHHSTNEARTSAYTTPYQMTVGEHLDNFARNGGIDYTVVGRAIHLWDTDRNIGETRMLTEADFFGEVIVTAYGSEHASVGFAVARDGRYGGSGGSVTTWKFLEKTGPVGKVIALPPSDSTPRRPSIADFGTAEGWNGYRYWMAYRPGSASTIRVAASKNGTTWADVSEMNVDQSGTLGAEPCLRFGYDGRLWLFWRQNTNALYRSRSEDGKTWTTAIRLFTMTGSDVPASPSLTYDAGIKQWILHIVDTGASPNVIRRRVSTNRNLDAVDQWGSWATMPLSLPAGREPLTIEAQRLGSNWVALITDTIGSDTVGVDGKVYIATAPPGQGQTWTRAASPAIPNSYPSFHNQIVKATFLQRVNGDLEVWYGGGLSSATADWKVYRTTLTGPAPDIGTGDPYMQYYGPWTKVFSVFDEEEESSPTQAELNSQARLNLTGRSPVPVDVRVPDNATIRLSNDLTLDMLIPGVHMPLLATLNARQVSQLQKLDRVTVTETATGEEVAIVLIPATHHSDEEPIEEG